MPWDALPENLRSPKDWKGTDNDVWWMRWEILTKGWYAFGPRSHYSWACWKFPPKVLLKIGGQGEWRYELVPGLYEKETQIIGYKCLSRCQYYKRWALVVEWPLSIRFHVYWRASDVPTQSSDWKNEFSISKLLFMYGPIHWDTQLVYWVMSFYIGGQWK